MIHGEDLKDIFLVLSIKNSKPGDKSLWWRANSSGYTFDINEAGAYTRKQVEENPRYYNNGIDTKAIPYLKILGHKDTQLVLEFNLAKNL
jgi:hypothetical protein